MPDDLRDVGGAVGVSQLQADHARVGGDAHEWLGADRRDARVHTGVTSGHDAGHVRAVTEGVQVAQRRNLGLERQVRALNQLVAALEAGHGGHSGVEQGDVDALSGDAAVVQTSRAPVMSPMLYIELASAAALYGVVVVCGCRVSSAVTARTWGRFCAAANSAADRSTTARDQIERAAYLTADRLELANDVRQAAGLGAHDVAVHLTRGGQGSRRGRCLGGSGNSGSSDTGGRGERGRSREQGSDRRALLAPVGTGGMPTVHHHVRLQVHPRRGRHALSLNSVGTGTPSAT